MVKQPEVLALIPARAGSKGIPGKNIKDFAGFPLIAYSILAGLRSNFVTRTIVSTDGEEIASVAKAWGAEVPFLRPEAFAQDDTLDLPVALHCLEWLKEHENYQPDVVVWLRPTSPIRPIDCVDRAVNLLLDHPQADSVRGVVEAAQNPYKMWLIDEESGVMKALVNFEGVEEPYNAPRQVLPQAFWQTGHIDAIRRTTITEKNSMTGDVILPLLIDPSYTVDIDLPQDWRAAEQILVNKDLDLVDPATQRRQFPEEIDLILLDFDGVLTDDRVWVDETGRESVAANRADGLGIEQLRTKTDIPIMVISRETNPVVAQRCQKLKLPVLQSVLDKDQAVKQVIKDKGLKAENVIFVGNDINDLEVFPVVGFAVAPANAHRDVLRRADLVLSKAGGEGAVRELCDMILSRLGSGNND
jgi:N-acylneuraminate cytidylyltransferase